MRISHHCKNLFLSFGKGLIISLLIITPFMGLNAAYPDFLSHLNAILSQNSLVCTLFRWAILILAFLFWPIIFRKSGQIWHWSPEQVDYWLRQRARIMMWLFLVEVIVCENLFLIAFNFWKIR